MKIRLGSTLILLAVLLAACASPSSNSGVPSTGSGNKVIMSGLAFKPETITIKVGQSVTWTNEDSVTHTVVADDNSWKSGNIDNGASFTKTFDTAGTFTYHCSIHTYMKGTIIVTP